MYMVLAPFSQAPDLDGQLFKRVYCSFLGRRLLVCVLVLVRKDIGVGCLVFFQNRVCLEGIQHVGYMGALERAGTTARPGAFGRRLEAGEGA
jgi:hypothetical protein